MITISLILVAAVISYFYFSTTNANTYKHNIDNAKSNLSGILDRLFYSVPLQDMLGNEKECMVSVRFTVNEFYELTNLKVNGGNEEIVKYTQSKLTEEIEKHVEEMEPSKYDVKLKFVLN